MLRDHPIAPNDLAGPAELAGALARLKREPAVALPFLGARARRTI